MLMMKFPELLMALNVARQNLKPQYATSRLEAESDCQPCSPPPQLVSTSAVVTHFDELST